MKSIKLTVITKRCQFFRISVTATGWCLSFLVRASTSLLSMLFFNMKILETIHFSGSDENNSKEYW